MSLLNPLMGGVTLATATAAKSGTTVPVIVNGQAVTIQVARDLPVASGDVLAVLKIGSEWLAAARYYGAAPAAPSNPAPPNPQPAIVTGTQVFAPVETRTYRFSASSWTDTGNDDVYDGASGGYGNHIGCVFYGSSPRSLAGATVLSATVQVQRLTYGSYAAQATTMRLMTDATRPAGAPTVTSTASGPTLAVGATDNTFALPTSWVQSMVDGAAGGIAFFESDGTPYVRFAGRGAWSPAFTMTINWQRG